MKTLIISSYVTPEIAGYADKYTILDDLGNMQRHGVCSACPNPFQPKTNKPWASVYGWVAAPLYLVCQCINHTIYGKSIILSGGGPIPARLPNSNHGGNPIISEVFVHCGDSEVWRGSRGCPSLPPSGWQQFIDCFEINELILFKLIDCTGMRQDECEETTDSQSKANTEDKVS